MTHIDTLMQCALERCGVLNVMDLEDKHKDLVLMQIAHLWPTLRLLKNHIHQSVEKPDYVRIDILARLYDQSAKIIQIMDQPLEAVDQAVLSMAITNQVLYGVLYLSLMDAHGKDSRKEN